MTEIYECIVCHEPLDAPGRFCSCRCADEYAFTNRDCEVCGGEFWDGGTSCTCENYDQDDEDDYEDDDQNEREEADQQRDYPFDNDDLPF